MYGMHLTEGALCSCCLMACESLHLWVLRGVGGGCGVDHVCRDLLLLLFCCLRVGGPIVVKVPEFEQEV